MKWPLRTDDYLMPEVGSPGDFASKRSFYFHSGIDLYCPAGTVVQSVETGKVVKSELFTGAKADPPSPWWNDTWSVLIEGKSGVIGYCELALRKMFSPGTVLFEGEMLGAVVPVLKKDKGNGTSMLHLELYDSGCTESVTWLLDEKRPKGLRNPRKLLEKINT